MKISISYLPSDPGEAHRASAIQNFFRTFLPDAKVRFSHRYDPYLHIYWTTKKPENPSESKENP